jgi:imidazolonepropionase-like amidohydrolase
MDELIVLRPEYVLADPPRPATTGRAVVVRGQRIEAVISAGGAPVHAKVLAFPGATLMPGLIDAHVHLTLCGCCTPRQTMMRETNEMLLLRAAENARQALRAGITTLRDCGDRDEVTFHLREAISRDVLPGPRLLLSGPPLTSLRGHCYFMGGEVEGRDDMARKIGGLVTSGADFIKVMATGGGLTPGTDSLALQFSPDDLAFIVSEAGRANRYVAAHAHSPESIRVCVGAGVRTIEHASFVDRGAIAADGAILQAMSSQTVIAVPTNIPAVHAAQAGRTLGLARQIGLTSEQFLEGRRRVLRELISSGVRVIAGSDAGATGVPFDSLLGEIELLAEGFGSTARAIAAATSKSADSLGVSGAGRIREGMFADLLIVAGRPEEDLQALRKPLLVMSRGRIL